MAKYLRLNVTYSTWVIGNELLHVAVLKNFNISKSQSNTFFTCYHVMIKSTVLSTAAVAGIATLLLIGQSISL